MACGMWWALSSGVALSGGLESLSEDKRTWNSCSQEPPAGLHHPFCHLWRGPTPLGPISVPPGCDLQFQQVYKQLLCLKHLSADKTPCHLEKNSSPRAQLAGCLGQLTLQAPTQVCVEWDEEGTVPSGWNSGRSWTWETTAK